MLKKIIVFLFILNISLSYSNNGSLKILKVNENRIEEIKLTITRRIKIHRLMRIVTPVGAAAVSLYLLYNTFYLGNSCVVKTGLSDINVIKLDERMTNIESYINKKNSSFFSYKWFKGQALGLVNYIAFGSLISISELAWKKFFHDDDISWFIKDHLSIDKLKEEIELYVKKINSFDSSMSNQQIVYYSGAIASACRRLIVQVEHVVAFMEYKLGVFKGSGLLLSNNDLLPVTHMISSANSFVESVQNLISIKKDTCFSNALKKQADKLLGFSMDFDLQIKRFIDIESCLDLRLINV